MQNIIISISDQPIMLQIFFKHVFKHPFNFGLSTIFI